MVKLAVLYTDQFLPLIFHVMMEPRTEAWHEKIGRTTDGSGMKFFKTSIANLSQSLTMKEFWKSVKIW